MTGNKKQFYNELMKELSYDEMTLWGRHSNRWYRCFASKDVRKKLRIVLKKTF